MYYECDVNVMVYLCTFTIVVDFPDLLYVYLINRQEYPEHFVIVRVNGLYDQRDAYQIVDYKEAL